MKGSKQSPVIAGMIRKKLEANSKTTSKIPQRKVSFKTPPVKKPLDGTYLIDVELPSLSRGADKTVDNARVEKDGHDFVEVAKDSLDCDWLTNDSKSNVLCLVNISTDSRLGNSNSMMASMGSNSVFSPRVTPGSIQVRDRHGLVAGSLDGGLGKLITEEDLLDTIFYSCDEHGNGRVPPSALLEFVKMIMLSSHLDDTPDMDELAHMLDPSDMDLPMDLATYQRAMSKWIEDIQERKLPSQKLINLSSEEEEEPPPVDDSPLPVTSTPMVPLVKPWTSRRAFSQTIKDDSALPSPLDIPCFSFGSNNANSMEISSREREADLLNQLEDLKFQARKLTDQNAKLQMQMESTEENNTHLLIELDTVQTKLKSSEVVIQRSMSVREQNEELHSEVKDLEGCRTDIEKKFQAVVEERDVLQVKMKNLMEEVEQAYDNMDEQKQSMDAMQELINNLQKEYQEAEEKLAMQSVELAEKSMQFDEIQGQVKELLISKETLKTEKGHLEDKVDELKQELASACQVIPGNVEYMQAGDGEGEMDCSALMLPPVTSSTPYKQPIDPAISMSIYSELRAVSTGTSLPPVYGILPVDEGSSPLRQPPPDTAAMDLVAKLKRKKEAILEEIQEIMRERTEDGGAAVPTNGLSKDVMTCINKEMDQILDEMKAVARSKQLSDERAKKLAKLLAEITDEKATLIRQHEEALGRIHQLNYDQQQLELIKTENEILEHSIEHEKSRLSLMEQRLRECQAELKESRVREVKWKRMYLDNRRSNDGIIQVDSLLQGKESHLGGVTGCPSHLIDALSLEGYRLPSRQGWNLGSGSPFPSGVSAVASPDRPPYQSLSLTRNSIHQVRRTRSEESSSFLTAPDSSRVLSTTREEYRTAAGSLSALSSSPPTEFRSARRDLSTSFARHSTDNEWETSFDSAVSSLDRNNNSESSRLVRGNSETGHPGSQRNPRSRNRFGTPTVKIFCEVGVQTVPGVPPIFSAFAPIDPAPHHRSDRLRRRSLPRLDWSRRGRVPELATPPSSPTSPLLKVPRLGRPDSPFSLDSEHSFSSQFSFKTALSSSPARSSSPVQSPKSFNCSREADVSSEEGSSRDSSLSGQSTSELFKTCTEAEWSAHLAQMDRTGKIATAKVDENFNKSENDGGSSSSAFSPVAKSKRNSFDRDRSYAATTFDEDGSMIDLISADLAEEPLTEADKEMNSKLIKESQAASERFWNRRGRTSSSDDTETEKSPADGKPGGNADHRSGEKRPGAPNQEVITTGQEQSGAADVPGKPGTAGDGAEKHKSEQVTSAGMDVRKQETRPPHRMTTFLPKVPELVEASETESGREAEESAPEADKHNSSDTEDARDEKAEAPPLKRRRSAILSDALLKSLGLIKGDKDPHTMSDKEVEMRFKDLSLALKSGQSTLEQRADIQKRERDLVEENMGKELESLLGSIQKFEQPDSDSALYEHVTKLKQQVKLLQSMKTNLASKAEGLGQVLQEKRISTACEVMVKYVDNLRSMLEIKQGELEEAKKLITENRLYHRPNAATSEDVKSRRTSSVAMSKGKRRASLAVLNLPPQQQDSRGRFHSFASSMRSQSTVTPPRPLGRTTSSLTDSSPSPLVAEKKSPARPLSTGNLSSGGSRSLPAISPLAQDGKSSTTTDSPARASSLAPVVEDKLSTNGKDDESFRLGFQQGVHNQVSQELEDLREQQRLMVENLEELIDSMEEDDKEEVVASRVPSYPQLPNFIRYPAAIPWTKVQKFARLAATVLLVVAACCSVIFTLMPTGSLKAGALVFESPLSTIQQFFWPYTSLVHSETPPR